MDGDQREHGRQRGDGPHHGRDPRGEDGAGRGQDEAQVPGRTVDRAALEERLEEVCLDLDARHPGVAREGRGELVVQHRRRRVDQHQPVAEDLRRHLASEHLVVGHGRERARRAAEVDAWLVGGRRGARGEARLAREAVQGEGEALADALLVAAAQGAGAHESIAVGCQVHEPEGSGARAYFGQRRVEVLAAAEVALRRGEGGGEDDVVDPGDRLGERAIVVGAEQAGLGEHDVQTDRDGAALADAIQQVAVQGPRERPAQVELVEGVLVDRHDDDRRDGGPRPAQPEPEIEALELQELESTRQREDPGEGPDARREAPGASRPEPDPHGRLPISRIGAPPVRPGLRDRGPATQSLCRGRSAS